MHRNVWALLLAALLASGACGGDDGGGSSSTGDGGAGSGSKEDGGGTSGKGGGSGSGGDKDSGAAGSGGTDKDGGSGTGSDKDASVPPDGAITDANYQDVPEYDGDFKDCTKVEMSDDVVMATQESDAMPSAAGGSIEDGTYVLTSLQVYPPAVANTSTEYRRLAKFDGDELTVVYFDDTGPRHDNAGTFTTSGSTLTFSITCPSEMPIPVMLSYSATSTTFALFDTDNSTVATYTKQ